MAKRIYTGKKVKKRFQTNSELKKSLIDVFPEMEILSWDKKEGHYMGSPEGYSCTFWLNNPNVGIKYDSRTKGHVDQPTYVHIDLFGVKEEFNGVEEDIRKQLKLRPRKRQ